MAYDDDALDDCAGPEACAPGPGGEVVQVTSNGQHFGRWWVAERTFITDDGVETGHVFYGYQPGRPDVVMIDGLETAREFAAQLEAALRYADPQT